MQKEAGLKNKPHISDQHPHHEKHLCSLVDKRKMKTVARLAKDAKYLCLICGRGLHKVGRISAGPQNFNSNNLCKNIWIAF